MNESRVLTFTYCFKSKHNSVFCKDKHWISDHLSFAGTTYGLQRPSLRSNRKKIVWILIFGFCCPIQNHLAYTKYKRVSTIFVIYPWKGSSLTGAISLLYLWLQMLSGKLFFCKGTLWAIIFFWLIISQWFPLGDGQEMYNYCLLFPGVIHRFSAIRP